jgi:ribonuclease M5
MLEISRPIIVEGKYDKLKLSRIVKANIITTDGFGIFSKEEKNLLIRRLAEARGVIVLTDSDGAGLVIRNHLRNLLPKEKVIHIYTPQIKGKEKRKDAPSKEGFLGVEGMELDWLTKALEPFADGGVPDRMVLTKADLYALGLSGREDSEKRRRALSAALKLPTNLSANALLEAIRMLITKEEFEKALEEIQTGT